MTTSDPIAPTTPVDALLTDEMLARFDERAPRYDRENRFFDEDFDELRESGLPLVRAARRVRRRRARLLDEYTKLARRLAYVAPATALAVNMHVLLDRRRRRPRAHGRRLVPLHPREGRRRARSSRAIHGEAGNDMPLLLSTTTRRAGRRRLGDQRATRSSAASRRSGPTAASTPWTPRTPTHPQIVHGFLPRDTPGIADRRDVGHARHARHPEPGHRARQGVLPRRAVPGRVPDRLRRRRTVPRGDLRLGAASGFAAVYLGAARAAFDITVAKMPKRTSIALTRSMAHHPEVQHHVAKMRMASTPPRRCSTARRRTGRPASSTRTGRCAWSAPGRS